MLLEKHIRRLYIRSFPGLQGQEDRRRLTADRWIVGGLQQMVFFWLTANMATRRLTGEKVSKKVALFGLQDRRRLTGEWSFSGLQTRP